MNRVPDRKKQRREYLRRKRKVLLRRFVLTALCGSPLFVVFLFALHSILRSAGSSHITALELAAASLLLIVPALLLMVGIRQDFRHDFVKLPYVPPVTPDTLPAEEVLVRSAEEPTVGSETLLRATVKGEETKAEELLRSSRGG